MSEEKKGAGGRPRGSRFSKQFTVYETERGMELLQAIAARWETTNAEAIRRLIRDKAQEMGLVDGSGAE